MLLNLPFSATQILPGSLISGGFEVALDITEQIEIREASQLRVF